MQGWVEGILDRVITWLANKAKSLLQALGLAEKPEEKKEDENANKPELAAVKSALDVEEQKYLEEGTITKEDAQKAAASVKENHPVLATINVVEGADSWDYEYTLVQRARLSGEKRKPIDLPAWNKLTVDWEHIFEGHWEGTDQPVGNNTMFTGLNQAQIRRVVKGAYQVAQKIRSQGDRVLVSGVFDGWTVEMWVNKESKTLESAYPVF